MHAYLRTIWVALVLAFAGCSPSGDLSVLAAKPAAYRLGPGDTLQIRVLGAEELNGRYLVQDDAVRLLMAGAVPAAGSTPEQLQAKIEDALAGAPAFVGTYTLTTSSAGLTCTDSASFAVSGTTLSIGATDVTGVRTYNICVTGTDSHFTNSPYTQQIALTGAAPAATITSVSLAP